MEYPLERKASFQARMSILDREVLHNGGPPMRGFLALFWITITLYATISMYRNSATYFMGVSLQLWRSSYRDFEALLVMIAAIYLYTYISLLYQYLLLKKILDSSAIRNRLISRHILQIIPILMAIFVANYRAWPHLQTGSLLLFSISINMKLHSFLITNEILDREYHSNKSERQLLGYPQNLNLNNFTLYLWFPTLIYELEYPKTNRVRWSYLFERTLGTIVIFCLFYVILSHYVHPILLTVHSRSFIDALVELLLPCLVSALLVFFLIFEYLLNWAAEVTCFADRKFYADWWNSTDMAEFARKWNVPVHRFLRYHVYGDLKDKYGLGRSSAQFLTFFYSSLLHELVISSTAKRVKFWMLAMQMLQIPLMSMARMLRLKQHPFFANCIWWLMIILGIPILVLLYTRDLNISFDLK